MVVLLCFTKTLSIIISFPNIKGNMIKLDYKNFVLKYPNWLINIKEKT